MAKTNKESSNLPTANVVDPQLEVVDPIAPIIKGEQFVERNQKLLTYIIGGIAAVGLAIGGYYYYITGQEEEAQRALFPAQFAFGADSLKLALNGDGNHSGFLQIIDDYPMTKASNLAKFYAGTIELKQGKFDDAIGHLSGFKAGDAVVQARAYSLVGDAYLEKGQPEDAAKWYEKASSYKPNRYFTPTYLMKLGLAYEKQQKWADADKAYGIIVKDFGDATEAQEARKLKALMETKLGK